MVADLTPGPAGRLAGLRVCVAGLGVSGPPAALALAARGAFVTAVDGRDDADRRAMAASLAGSGITVRLGEAAAATVPAGTELVVTSPGWLPGAPLLAAAAQSGIEVIGDVELGWRLRPQLADGSRQRWLAVTGTNGKTTTVRMLAAMLAAAGHRTLAVGNVGTSVVQVVTAAQPFPVLAVELSSFQLHWTTTLCPDAAVVLNIAAHHLDWHGDIGSYVAAKGRIYGAGTAKVFNADDEQTAKLAAAAPGPGQLAGFRLGEPAAGELGVAGGQLVDRAFGGAGAAPPPVAVPLAAVSDVRGPDPDGRRRPPAPHNVANALAAAALARAYGVAPGAVAAGLAAYRPDPHRIAFVAQVAGVDYVDDSKATNPHAAAASVAAFGTVVWIAGGLYQSAAADLDELVALAAPRLRGAVLLGTDRSRFAAALARHAPDVPVTEVTGTDTGIMNVAVRAAARLARPGDTVLLAPAAQSFDMFTGYPARGAAFAAAVGALAAPS